VDLNIAINFLFGLTVANDTAVTDEEKNVYVGSSIPHKASLSEIFP